MTLMINRVVSLITLQMLFSMPSYAKKIVIPFYIPSGATTESSRMYFDLIGDFEQINRDINVIYKPMNHYDEVLNTVIEITQKKQNAGVVVVEISALLTLKDAGAIIALDQLLKQSEEHQALLKQIIPGFLANSFGDDGKIYGIPLIRSTPIIYYNLDILNQAGITVKQLPDTWDGLTDTLRKIKKHTGQPPFMLAPIWYDWIFEAFVRQNGGALATRDNSQVLFDHPATIEALAYWKMLKDEGLMLRKKGSWKSVINGFNNGQFPGSLLFFRGNGAVSDE